MERKINTGALIYKEKMKVNFYDLDYKKRVKISALLKMSAEIAGSDYIFRGLDHEFLWENGYVFLLSRISLHIERFPQGSFLDASTWECGKKGAMFLRGYELCENGEICADGISGWVVANPNTRKIIRPSAFPWLMPQFCDKGVKALPIDKIQAENLEPVGEHVVKISDLDANGHVYNANYADIAANFLPEDFYEGDISDFRINFINEATLGEKIEILRELSPNRAVVAGNIGGRPCFETEFLLRK